MKHATFILLFFIASSFVSEGNAQNSETEITNTLIEMWSSIENSDLEKYASFIHPEYTSFGENDVYRKEGKAVEIEGIRNWLAESSNIHTEMHQPKVVVKGDVAWITYYWSDRGNNNDGTTFSTRGKSTRIFVRENGKWLCIHGHFTAVE